MFFHQARGTNPELAAALERRWAELPDHVRTPAQLLGRRLAGCEGTHGVFPQCDFACKPCYHSADANRVRIDGAHTIAEVDRQMTYLRARRGPGQYAQLIGGEVSLLTPEDHAATLEVMIGHDRVPMSFTHGDFDYDYLEALAVRPDGTARFAHLSFAGHFDITMVGRRGAEKPQRESELHEHRARFCAMFARLEREHGITSYLAHNMTVTPANLDQVAEVVAHCRGMGFRMFSFQPAAFVGNESRWRDDYRTISDDDVWAEVEAGAGTRLPYTALQVGDLRCNRVVWGLQAGDRFVAVLDDREPADLEARDAFFRAFPGNLQSANRGAMAVRIGRGLLFHPRAVPVALGWSRRLVRRAGGVRRLVRGVAPRTFVMHSFMDANAVAAAWTLMEEGGWADDPSLRAVQERLRACAYTMAHPDTQQLIPACVQHGVLDPAENAQLVTLLPRRRAGQHLSESQRSSSDR